jgi:hypothetical protein
MQDRADEIVSTFLYDGKEGRYVICKEAVFQTTSKSSEGGSTSISGYNEYRISSYEVATGKLSARMEMGEGREEGEFCLLGETEGKLWVYSLDKELGLHYRNPKTLEVIATQEQLWKNPSLKNFPLARPSWTELDEYFGFSWGKNQLILTDAQGFSYYLDPQDFSLQKTNEKAERVFSPTWLSQSEPYGSSYSLSLKGEHRRVLEMGNKVDSVSHLSFLFGTFVVDNSRERKANRKKSYLDSLRHLQKEWSLAVQDYEKAHPANIQGYASPIEFSACQTYATQKGSLANLSYQLEHPPGNFGALLSDAPHTFLVYHANNISDTSTVQLSYIRENSSPSFLEAWTCPLPFLYFSPDKAYRQSSFETVFSEGSPQYRYQWWEVSGHTLLFIAQLKMACIDLQTGKLLWKQDL